MGDVVEEGDIVLQRYPAEHGGGRHEHAELARRADLWSGDVSRRRREGNVVGRGGVYAADGTVHGRSGTGRKQSLRREAKRGGERGGAEQRHGPIVKKFH